MSPHLPCGGLPLSFSILRTVSRNSRNSSAVEPTTWLAMIEEEAWPSAQAFTSWAKSVHGAVHLQVDLDGGAAQLGMGGGAGVGVGEAAEAGDIPREFDDPLVIDVIQHEIRCPGRQ